MKNQTIDSLHRNKSGKVSNKWDSYLTYYDEIFSRIRYERIKLFEIGVQNGGSLDTWSSYFENGILFLGCDIDEKCSLLSYDDPRVKVIVGNANELTTFKNIIDTCSAFDIVIDDGSHMSMDILNSFISYFPYVKPGGVYIIEDTHSLYLDNFGGGILNDNGGYAFFKKMIDVINFQFWQDQVSINTYFRTFFPLASTPSFILDGTIDSIEFRNSIITINKSLSAGHDKLGTSITSGTSAKVQTFGGKFSSN